MAYSGAVAARCHGASTAAGFTLVDMVVEVILLQVKVLVAGRVMVVLETVVEVTVVEVKVQVEGAVKVTVPVGTKVDVAEVKMLLLVLDITVLAVVTVVNLVDVAVAGSTTGAIAATAAAAASAARLVVGLLGVGSCADVVDTVVAVVILVVAQAGGATDFGLMPYSLPKDSAAAAAAGPRKTCACDAFAACMVPAKVPPSTDGGQWCLNAAAALVPGAKAVALGTATSGERSEMEKVRPSQGEPRTLPWLGKACKVTVTLEHEVKATVGAAPRGKVKAFPKPPGCQVPLGQEMPS